MALPIKPTPTLHGKDARIFEERMRQAESTYDKKGHKRALNAYRLIKHVQ